MIHLHVLGAFDVRSDRPGNPPGGMTQPKRLALLLYLALSRPTGLHARDRLLAMLWPDADDASSRHSLRNALHALRQALGDEAIVTRGESYVGLDFNLVHCDALELRAHIAAGRLDDAVALWKGDLAPGFHVSGSPDFDHWMDDQRQELRRDVRAAAWKRAQEVEGTAAEANAIGRAMQLDPGNEPGARRLMLLLEAQGDRGGALRAYRAVADYFSRELESQPSPETTALAARLRLAPVPGRPTPPPSVPVVVPATEEPVARPGRSRYRRRRPLIGVAVGAGVLTLLAFATRGSGTRRDALPLTTTSQRAPIAEDAVEEAQRAVLRLPARYRVDTAAYTSYLRGLTLRFQFRFLASRDTFAALVDREPLYVPGLYGLAHAYIFTTLNDLTGADETWPKIEMLARQALALDSTAASAWLALAARGMHDRLDLPEAAERIARARLLDSLDPDVAGLQSVWFRFHGQMDSAVALAEHAHRLDPLSQYFGRLVGRQLYFARRFDESRVVFEGMLRDDPTAKRVYADLGDVYRAMGRPRDAVEWYRRAAMAAGDSGRAALLAGASSDTEARRQLAADAQRAIGRLRRASRAGELVPASRYAAAYAKMRDTTATLRWLDSMATRQDTYLYLVRADPLFDFLREVPRYKEWEAHHGVPISLPTPSAGRYGELRVAAPAAARRSPAAPPVH